MSSVSDFSSVGPTQPSSPSQLGATLKKLRPAKLSSALSRRWFERQMPHTPMHPIDLKSFGNEYGGWQLPAGLIDSSWTCYMVGAGGDISVDIELARDYGTTVRTFDAVDSYVQSARREANGEPHITVVHAAIATADGPIRMQVTHDPNSSSVSAAKLYDSADYIELPGRTLRSLMDQLGDERIDLLKLDIEGLEYEVLPTVDLHALGVKVFATQLHHTVSVGRARALMADLRRQGYVPVACIPAVKFTFVHSDLL
jgi:FkbM family methyltransferase